MLSIDLNCDLGEGFQIEEAIMPFISSANIACGYHAGNEHIMKRVVELALIHGVAIGAHPSFDDSIHFGRIEMPWTPAQIFQIITEQLIKLSKITIKTGGRLSHVKPHGALYNMAAKNRELSASIVRAVKEFDPTLLIFGLSGSKLINEARSAGLEVVNEAFIDRSYQDDGTLTPRSTEQSMIIDPKISINHALNIITNASVSTVSGKQILLKAETLCIHGDSPGAAELARQVHEALVGNGIEIQPPLSFQSRQ